MLRNLKKSRSSAVLLLLCSWFTLCYAQFSSNVQGTVTDANGAAVPNARVTLHNAATGIDDTGATNGDGLYRFTSVAPGQYQVVVEAPGFDKSQTAANVLSEVTTGVDVRLRVARVNTNVTVNSIAQALNPDETRLQTTIGAGELSKLPLPNRNPLTIQQLAPGVTGIIDSGASSGYGGATIFAQSVQPLISANGLSSASNIFIVDDLPMDSSATKGDALIIPNPDMIQEASLQTTTFSVEYGQSASMQTAYTTKSGTNQFHGDLDYSNTGKWLSAVPDFSTGNYPFHRNIFTAALGGPVWKDRTFFFGSVERLNSVGTLSQSNTWISPEFGTWAYQKFPNNGGAKELYLAPPTRDQFVSTTEYATDVFGTGPGGCGTAATFFIPCSLPIQDTGYFPQSTPYNGQQWSIRLDQYFRDGKDRISASYIALTQNQGYLSDRGALDASSPSQNSYIAGSYTHIFSSNLINEAHFGNVRSWGGTLGNTILDSTPYGTIICCQGGFFGIFTPFASSISKSHTYEFRDNVSWTKGQHSFRFGFEWDRLDNWLDDSSIYSRPFFPAYNGLLQFVQDQTTGWSTYTIGGNGKYQPQIFGSQVGRFSGYAQDEWKIRPGLLLSLGIRYDDFGNPSAYGNNALPFVPLFLGSGSTPQARVLNLSTGFQNNAFSGSENLNFMPRGGFNWTPSQSRNISIRGGIGFFEDAVTPYQVSNTLPTQPPNRLSLSPSIYSSDPALANPSPTPFGDFHSTAPPYGFNYPSYPTYGISPHGGVYQNAAQTQVYQANLNGYDRNLKPDKALIYNFGLNWQSLGQVVFGLNYSGSHSWDGLANTADWNTNVGAFQCSDAACDAGTFVRPTSNWGTINYGTNALVGNYNALIATAQQNYKSWSWQASYTWSHTLADTYILATAPHQFYSDAPYDRRNAFSFGGSYTVPRMFNSYWKNQALAGWQLSEIAVAQSGPPFTVTTGGGYNPSNDYNLDGVVNDYPNYIGRQHSGWTRAQYKAGIFGKGAAATALFPAPSGFQTNPREGNVGNNTFRDPGYFNMDTALQKGLSLPWFGGEKSTLFLRFEALNTLNRANLGSVTNSNDNQLFGASQTFGAVTSVLSPRYLQLGGRFEF